MSSFGKPLLCVTASTSNHSEKRGRWLASTRSPFSIDFCELFLHRGHVGARGVLRFRLLNPHGFFEPFLHPHDVPLPHFFRLTIALQPRHHGGKPHALTGAEKKMQRHAPAFTAFSWVFRLKLLPVFVEALVNGR